MYHLTARSRNEKTGHIPVSTSDRTTCPKACPLLGDSCYATAGFHLAMHWAKVSEGDRGVNWAEFLKQVRQIAEGALWRHNQAGDLPGHSNAIDVAKLAALVAANRGRKGFTYTHKPVQARRADSAEQAAANRRAIRAANANGFTINLSADNPRHADQLATLKVGPVVCIVPDGTPDVSRTPAGRKLVVCPAQTRDGVTCSSCGMCARSERPFVVGFLAHGSGKKRALEVTQ